jgi:hypothetical protein
MENGIGTVGLILYFGVIILVIAGNWKIYEKAGKPGWACIIPIYNIIVLLEIIRKPWWWLLLLLVPFVNIVILFLMYIELAKAFGKSALYGIGMIFLAFILIPMLGFGSDRYILDNTVRDPNILDGNM